MSTVVTFPGGVRVRAVGWLDRGDCERPAWGVYADPSWDGWPGVVLDWPDFSVPADDDETVRVLLDAWDRATAGHDVLVGCLGGSGRTGTVLGAFAILAGVAREDAIAWVRRHYRHSAIEAPRQERWLLETFATRDEVMARDR